MTTAIEHIRSRRRAMRKAKSTLLTTDYCQVPPYSVEDYNDGLRLIMESFDKLCEFASEEMEEELVTATTESTRKPNWKAERQRVEAKLADWEAKVHHLLGDLYGLFFAIREERSFCEHFNLEASKRESAASRKRRRRGKK